MADRRAGDCRAAPASPWDVAVIGGGVVGCAVARRFTLEGARTVLLERAPDILSGASKGNSALLHTGYDAPARSIELACVRAGYAEYLEIRERLNLPLIETGAVLVAWTDEQEARLDGIVEHARGNGLHDVRRTEPDEIRARIPGVALGATGGVLIPGEHVIDPWSAPLAYLRQAVENGAAVMLNAEVTAGVYDGSRWTLETPRGPVRATTIVNCAGLHGDIVDRQLLGETEFTIRPRKGQFAVFDKAAAAHLRTIVLPVPTERTKGVLLAPTAFGNVLVGPTAEDQDERDRATVDAETLAGLVRFAASVVPALGDIPVTATYAGLRPASERKEYRIAADRDRNRITIGGIRSTGLTGSLGIARHVFDLYAEWGGAHAALPDPIWSRVPNLAEHAPRDWQCAGHGEIVCHCEMVTLREIEAALGGPLPAGDLAGLRRRTRAMMGRCQGFYCTARVAEITGDRLADPLAIGRAHG